VSSSPGLRAASYPGWTVPSGANPNGVVALLAACSTPCHYPHLFRTHISTSTWYSKTPGKPRELGLPPSTDGVHALSAKSCATARRSRAADHRFVKRSGIMTYIISLTQQTLQKMWVMTSAQRRNPLGVDHGRVPFPQGSSLLATLGFGPESRWDSPAGSRSPTAENMARRVIQATQNHINATSKPPQCVLMANRLRPKPVSLLWGNGGGTVGERWGKATNSQPIATPRPPQSYPKAHNAC
jgi:hypothetical protein